MSVEFHDPRGEPVAEPVPYDLKADLSKPVTIGLLSNGFPDAVEFLEKIQTAISPKIGDATFKLYDKGDPTLSISEEMLSDIEADCTAVVSAYGH